jgi:hypothetical protein
MATTWTVSHSDELGVVLVSCVLVTQTSRTEEVTDYGMDQIVLVDLEIKPYQVYTKVSRSDTTVILLLLG